MAERLPLLSILVSSITGMAFAIGWWLIILGMVLNSREGESFSFFLIIFPILTTAAVALLTTVSRSAILSQNSLFSSSTKFQHFALFAYIALAILGFAASLLFFLLKHQGTSMAKSAICLPIGTAIIAFR